MRRVEVEERDEPGTFIVQWYRDGQRVDILFLTAPVCSEIVNRLILDGNDPLWQGVAADIDAILARLEAGVATEQHKLDEVTARLRGNT